MAHIEKRQHTTKNGSRRVYWRLRYEGPDGRLRSETFARKADADRRRVEVEADLQRGTWVDHRLGQVRFADYAADWRATKADLAPQTMGTSGAGCGSTSSRSSGRWR